MPPSLPPKIRPENPLSGQRILVTRAEELACRLTDLIRSAGGNVISHPVIELDLVTELEVVDRVIDNLASYSWLVFVSPNGVRFFLERMRSLGKLEFDLSSRHKIAAIGSSTARYLKSFSGVDVDLIPPKSNSESLGKKMVEADLQGKILVVRADRGSEELGKELARADLDFEEIAVYQSADILKADPEVTRQLLDEKIDWVTITSSAIARSTIALFGDALHKAKLASISPATTEEIKKLGFNVSSEAKSYDFDGMVNAMIDFQELQTRSSP